MFFIKTMLILYLIGLVLLLGSLIRARYQNKAPLDFSDYGAKINYYYFFFGFFVIGPWVTLLATISYAKQRIIITQDLIRIRKLRKQLHKQIKEQKNK